MTAPRHSQLDRLLEGFAAAPPVAVAGLALDSRHLLPGEAFVAVRGTREHGLRHLPQALARGASAIVWEPADGLPAPQAAVPCVAVEGLSVHLGEIAARHFGRPSEAMFVAGITGTDGKTSTAHLLAQAFAALGRPCAYLGTLGIGLPGALDAATHTTPDAIGVQRHLSGFRDQGLDACAMEVSSHALDQHRVGGVRFDAAVLTNLTRDHLDYHGTLERYAQAKRRLFVADDGRVRVLNRDDAQGAQWIEALAGDAARLRVYGIGEAQPAQPRYAMARAVELHAQGLRFALDCERGRAQIDSPLLGRFNVYNLLAAVSVLLEAGHSPDEAARALGAARTVPGRIEAFRGPGSAALAVVDYAHTPKALEQVLLALRPHARGRLICVFGCGGDRDRGKRGPMGEVAARLADRMIVTDDNPRSEDPAAIVAAIVEGVREPDRARLRVEHDRARAIGEALREAADGDVVLVAGKGHETTQTYGAEVRPFSDRDIVARLLGASA